MSENMICPCCNKEVGSDHFACVFAVKGGTAGRGKPKVRTPEHTRAAALARWGKKVTVSLEPVIEPEDPLHAG